MKTTYDCIPCFIRQALDAVRLATSDEKIHEQVLRGVLAAASKMNLDQSPPVMGQYIHKLIRELSGHDDPYKEIKKQFNNFAIKLYPDLKQRIQRSSNPMDTAVRMAIAGNIIDFGVNSELDRAVISDVIEQALSAKVFGNIKVLCDSIDSGGKYPLFGGQLRRNCFRLLTDRTIACGQGNICRKGRPDHQCCYNGRCTGNRYDRTCRCYGQWFERSRQRLLDKCSKEFRECFAHADLIIAKGQGNYETLSGSKKNISSFC